MHINMLYLKLKSCLFCLRYDWKCVGSGKYKPCCWRYCTWIRIQYYSRVSWWCNYRRQHSVGNPGKIRRKFAVMTMSISAWIDNSTCSWNMCQFIWIVWSMLRVRYQFFDSPFWMLLLRKSGKCCFVMHSITASIMAFLYCILMLVSIAGLAGKSFNP